MPTDGDDDLAAALECQREGEAAELQTRWRDAITAYEQALTLLPAAEAGSSEVPLLTALGRSYWNVSEARPAWRALRRAISLCQDRGDALGQARATVEILRIWGPPDRQRVMADEALEVLGDADPHLRARLLLRRRWSLDDANAAFDEAIAIAERHGFEDILVARKEREGWRASDEGRVDESIDLLLTAHREHARFGAYDAAAGVLRGAGFGALECGMLDRGCELAERALEYAMSVHLSFTTQLVLMDMAGVAFARNQFARCEELLGAMPGDSDFRVDLYRLWMAEEQGGAENALRLLVSPERGGGATTAMGQIHGAAAGALFRAGKTDAAREALHAWADVPRDWEEDYCHESPALVECLLSLGDEELLTTIRHAFAKWDDQRREPARYTPLQGRALAPVRGGIAMRLGLIEEARRYYLEGAEWCERERLPRDAELCRRGLARLPA